MNIETIANSTSAIIKGHSIFGANPMHLEPQPMPTLGIEMAEERFIELAEKLRDKLRMNSMSITQNIESWPCVVLKAYTYPKVMPEDDLEEIVITMRLLHSLRVILDIEMKSVKKSTKNLNYVHNRIVPIEIIEGACDLVNPNYYDLTTLEKFRWKGNQYLVIHDQYLKRRSLINQFNDNLNRMIW